MVNPAPGIERWALIEASPEVVFAYLTDLSSHGEWDEHSGFVVVGISEGSVVEGSSCQRKRVETFQAPLLRGGVISNQVTWIKSLTVIGCEPNYRLDFETKDLYNGLSVGSQLVSFRLLPEGSRTVLVMTDKKNPHLPGPFHLLMMGVESLKSLIAQPVVGILFRSFPTLRANNRLRRIKNAVERA